MSLHQIVQVGEISTGLGIPGNKLDSIIGIFKAYTTRGKGPSLLIV